MRKSLSVEEFKQYIDNARFSSFYLSSENQDWGWKLSPIFFDSDYTQLDVHPAFKAVSFKTSKSSIKIENINNIFVDPDSSLLGDIIEIKFNIKEKNTRVMLRFLAN